MCLLRPVRSNSQFGWPARGKSTHWRAHNVKIVGEGYTSALSRISEVTPSVRLAVTRSDLKG